jgi:hypothetical protein
MALEQQNRLTDALGSYRAGLSIQDRLAAEEPKAVELQLHRAQLRMTIGLLLVKGGDLHGARDILQEGRSIIARLKRRPNQAGLSENLEYFDAVIAGLDR